jgi:hypothetical protein
VIDIRDFEIIPDAHKRRGRDKQYEGELTSIRGR